MLCCHLSPSDQLLSLSPIILFTFPCCLHRHDKLPVLIHGLRMEFFFYYLVLFWFVCFARLRANLTWWRTFAMSPLFTSVFFLFGSLFFLLLMNPIVSNWSHFGQISAIMKNYDLLKRLSLSAQKSKPAVCRNFRPLKLLEFALRNFKETF